MTTSADTPRRRSVVVPLLAATACILTGLVLLQPVETPADDRTARPAAQQRTHDPAPEDSDPATGGEESTVPDDKGSDPRTALTGVPVAGDGRAGDRAVQRVLDRASTPNLARSTERELVELATQIWKAEVTGKNRARWPGYFTDQPLRSPFRHVRIQAAIARATDLKDNRVEVRLVWAGARDSSPVEDGRLGQVVLTHDQGRWLPVR
ncbi:hypothetical protein [Streptomyces cavernicola]|uniref:Lipoprotein n=1 Tax=Streptomyces cavernicola TaxID=3043613 RepID=A0ABT6SK80_9ACTN|nr:hypothetical protein [Streptomyces sp. B-S-A6]MDI3408345.1 hypothetical protein [Streptomyces sp. B-S-A6]